MQHLVRGRGRERQDVGEARHEALIIGNDRAHLRLLQHDFRDPHPVGAALALPGQVMTARARVPGEQRGGDGGLRCRHGAILVAPGCGRRRQKKAHRGHRCATWLQRKTSGAVAELHVAAHGLQAHVAGALAARAGHRMPDDPLLGLLAAEAVADVPGEGRDLVGVAALGTGTDAQTSPLTVEASKLAPRVMRASKCMSPEVVRACTERAVSSDTTSVPLTVVVSRSPAPCSRCTSPLTVVTRSCAGCPWPLILTSPLTVLSSRLPAAISVVHVAADRVQALRAVHPAHRCVRTHGRQVQLAVLGHLDVQARLATAMQVLGQYHLDEGASRLARDVHALDAFVEVPVHAHLDDGPSR